MKLRPYQQECLDAIKNSVTDKMLVVLPTGTGKTQVFSNLPKIYDKDRFLVVAHRDELITQTFLKMQLINPHKTIGIEKAENKDGCNKDIVIASVQSMNMDRIKRLGKFDSLVIDECFVAGTLVDGKPIERYNIGDEVISYNESTMRVEKRKINKIFKNKANALIKIKINNKDITCTYGHPFYTKRGWVSADHLTHHDNVLYYNLLDKKKAERQEERRFFAWHRVEGIKILKQTGDGTFGGMCSDGYVYNLEVEDNHNYFVNNILVHNCHHATANSYLELVSNIKPKRIIGFTATPQRADGIGLQAVFDDIVYKKDLVEMIYDGWLCRVKAIRVYVKFNKNIKVTAGDYNTKQLEDEMNKEATNIQIANAIHKYAKKRKKILVFASGIKHAIELCEEIHKITGRTVSFIHYKMKKERSKILKDFHNGKIEVLVNCMLLTEGYDEPDIDCVVMARPTVSGVLYSQMLGRGTRLKTHGGDALLIDIVGNTEKNEIKQYTSNDLFGLPPKLGLQENDVLDVKEQFDKAIKDNPYSDLGDSEATDINDFKVKAKKISLFKLNKVCDDLKGKTNFSWIKTPNGYRLPLAKKNSYIDLRIDALGRCNFYECINGRLLHTVVFKNIDVAIPKIDKYVKENYPDVITLIKCNANWRKEEISEKQLSLLELMSEKEQVAERVDGIKLDKLSKGEASSLLSILLN